MSQLQAEFLYQVARWQAVIDAGEPFRIERAISSTTEIKSEVYFLRVECRICQNIRPVAWLTDHEIDHADHSLFYEFLREMERENSCTHARKVRLYAPTRGAPGTFETMVQLALLSVVLPVFNYQSPKEFSHVLAL